MPSITLIQAGDETVIHDSAGAALLLDADGNTRCDCWLVGGVGTGMAPLHFLSERGPQQHGDTYRGFVLDPREIAYVFELGANTPADLDDGREALYQLLTPTDDGLQLKIARQNGTTRQIGARYSGGFTGDTKEIDAELYQRIALTFTCRDPLWFDPEQVAETFGASGASAGMAVPWQIPWKLGASSISQARTLSYTGTFETSPIVRIAGPITDAVITNASSPGADRLDFTGTTIAGGAYYEVDCTNKTVRDHTGTNQIAKLLNSDLATFAIHPHPIAAGGANTIVVGGSGISGATQVYLTYYRRYIGA